MTSRRSVVVMIVAAPIFASARQLSSNADDDSFKVQIRGDESVRDTIPVAFLSELKVSHDSSRSALALKAAVPPGKSPVIVIYIILGVIALPTLIRVIREMIRAKYYGGVLIDLRKDPPLVTNDPKLPPETLTTIGTDGAVHQIPIEDPSDITLRTAVMKALGK